MKKVIKIVSDGTPEGTSIYDALGNRIEEMISRIEISIEPRCPVTATVVFLEPEIEIVAEKEET